MTVTNIEERLVKIINLASIESDDTKKTEYLNQIKELALNHGLPNNIFQDIVDFQNAQSIVQNIDFLKYSPDNTLICSGSKTDKRIKVWYRIDGKLTFMYLNHPMPVTSLEWRRNSDSLEVLETLIKSSRGVANVLISSCLDKRVRIWVQTLNDAMTLPHFHLAGVIEATGAHFVNNKAPLLQDILARKMKSSDPEALVDQFDEILESTLKEWRSTPDLVFYISKSDGTLHSWQLKYLDGEESGLFRQVQIVDNSTVRSALPLHYATTMSENVITYSQGSNTFMLTQHLSGTLGLWKLNLDTGVDLVTRITGLPISPAWLRNGYLSVQYDDDKSQLTTSWTPDSVEPADMEEVDTFDGNSNLYKASRIASDIKILPQYHLKQLLELLAFGKVQRVKAILNHLVVNQSRIHGTEVSSIKPLSLYLLLESDKEKPNSGEHHAHEEFSATFESIMQSKSQVEETLDEILGKSTLETINKQKELKKLASEDQGKESLTDFNPRKAKMLTKILTHTHLPGLSNVDQMHLLAVADALAFFDASPEDLNELHEEEASQDQSQEGGMSIVATNIAIDSMDDRGLRFLTAMRQYVYLTKYLPIKQRIELREDGIGSHNLVWAFHSETQEELIGLIPCVQRNKPNWAELREFGIGWWVKKLEVLRKLIEKVAQSAYQARQDPLDAALFYLAMKKKTLVCALLRRVNCDKRLLKLFEQDFNDPLNKKKALKNAYALLGKHRFEHAAAFFLLAGSIWDAVEVCINNLNDIQLGIVLIRLYDNDPSNLKRLLLTEILGSRTSYDPQRAHKDAFLRSMAFWKLGDYLSAVHTLLDGNIGNGNGNSSTTTTTSNGGPDTQVSAGLFNFYRFLKDQPLVSKHKQQLMEEFELKRRTSPIEEEQVHFHRARSLSSGQLGFEGVGVAAGAAEASRHHQVPGAVKQSSTEYEVLNETTHLVDQYSDEAVAGKERRLFFSTAQTYLQSGCPLLALEVLCSEDHLNMSQAQRMKFIACLHILLNELNTLAQDFVVRGARVRRIRTLDANNDDNNDDDDARIDDDDDDNDGQDLSSQYHQSLSLGSDGISVGGGGGCAGSNIDSSRKFSDIFVEWFERNIEALRQLCSYSGSEEPILRTMLTYCSLHIAAEESLNTVRMQLLEMLSLDQQDNKVQ